MTDLVKRFDNLRSQAKKYKKPSASLKDEHNVVLTQLQTNVMELRTEKLSNLKKVEQNYEIHKIANNPRKCRVRRTIETVQLCTETIKKNEH